MFCMATRCPSVHKVKSMLSDAYSSAGLWFKATTGWSVLINQFLCVSKLEMNTTAQLPWTWQKPDPSLLTFTPRSAWFDQRERFLTYCLWGTINKKLRCFPPNLYRWFRASVVLKHTAKKANKGITSYLPADLLLMSCRPKSAFEVCSTL